MSGHRASRVAALLALWTTPVDALDCWSAGYDASICCDTKFGPKGNPSCWNGPYNYDACCRGAAADYARVGSSGGGGKGQVVRKRKDVDGVVVGIDLGTTYSAVAVLRGGRVEVIPNDQGNRIMPSVVSFLPDGERLVGEAARNVMGDRPGSTVYDVKRLIGRGFSDRCVQEDRKSFPFQVVNRDGRPYVQVSGEGTNVAMAPEEISALVLAKLKASAEAYLGEPVRHAVVTVPAYFDDNQRSATKVAGEIAGLNVARVLNEPTAAAMAYGYERWQNAVSGGADPRVLVYDLGGGTFDVSILSLNLGSGVFETMATCGDTHLGGEDFDRNLVDYLLRQFKQQTGKDAGSDRRAVQRLRLAAEQAKRALSLQPTATVDVEGFFKGKDFREEISRAKFERLNQKLFDRTLKPVDQVLKDAGLQRTDITEVILVGGSTRIPKIQKMMQDYFSMSEPPRHVVSPDEAVAVGAAIQADVLWRGSSPGRAAAAERSAGGALGVLGAWLGGRRAAGLGEPKPFNVILVDVTPISLGIEIHGGAMVVLIARNSALPTQKARLFSTVHDDQTDVYIPVFQGELQVAKQNSKLGEMVLSGIPKAPRGVPQIVVTFSIDTDGILHVTAEEQGTKRSASVTLNANKGRLSEDEVKRMAKKARKAEEADKGLVLRSDSKTALESYVAAVRGTLLKSSGNSALTTAEHESLGKAVKSVESWLEKVERPSAEVLQKKRERLEEIAAPLASRAAALDAPEDDDEASVRLGEL